MSELVTPEATADIRPVVGRKVNNRGAWIFAAILAIGGGSLFGALNARRTAITSPTVTVPLAETSVPGGRIPNLIIPPDDSLVRRRPVDAYLDANPASAALVVASSAARAAPSSSPGMSVPATVRGPELPMQQQPSSPPAPGYVYQASAVAPLPALAVAEARNTDGRAKASRLQNPSTTVPQGTVIQAVLETALNSNHAGFARAVVAQDVSSFDGTRVLVPKGSKLFGEYKSNLSLGQNRALIRWRRLTRPDGSIIDVDSPTADPLGRAGVKGKVDSHFFQRFGGAILQSALDVGVQLAARRTVGDTVILGLPNSSQSITTSNPDDIRPTIKVRQGTSVSVFVGRDLDFTEVEP